ncbi:MAG: RDD family protein [Planctomycetes bacterium]|nr:RDD family protein [Planctomycetota bacterium]
MEFPRAFRRIDPAASHRLFYRPTPFFRIDIPWYLGGPLGLNSRICRRDPLHTIRRNQSIQAATWISIGIIPVLVSVLQWVLISTSGQSIGKKLMLIRNVTDQGYVPGFLCGVMMRSWIPGILCMIPIAVNYLYVLDAICYLFAGRKCAYDYIASTRVVSIFS